MLKILGMILLTAVLSASAKADPYVVKFQTVLTDLDGKGLNWDCKVLSEDKEKCLEWRETTLALLSTAALTKQWPDDNLKIEDQIRRTLLAQEIYKKEEVSLDSKDADLLCTLIAKLVSKGGLNTLFTFRAIELIDPARLKRKE